MKALKEVIAPLLKVFEDSGALNPPDRSRFHQEILEITRRRTKVALLLVILLEVSNLIVNILTSTHSQYASLYRSGALILLALSFSFYLLLTYVRKRTAYARLVSVYSCWTLLLGGSVVFSYAEMAVSASLSNYTLFMLALGVIPVMRLGAGLTYILLYLGANLALGIHLGLAAHLIQQILLLAIFAFFGYWIQYSSALKVFYERHQLKHANLTLEKLSETDALTGLLNRRGLQKTIGKNKGLRRQSDENICLMMLDIDHFKDYNDQYLHLAGDNCLQKIARCLTACAGRRLDIVARYGGDEFVIAVYNIRPEDVPGFAMRISAAVRRLQIPFRVNQEVFHITVSIGAVLRKIVSTPPETGLLLKELLEEADQELYNAKLNGRDCVSYQGGIYHDRG